MKKIPMVIIMMFCLWFTPFFSNAQSQNSATGFDLNPVKSVLVGEQLPKDFWTYKHLFYINGDTVRKDLSEYKGKLLVLDFWATWCAICLAQMKDKQGLFAVYPTEASFLLVNPYTTKDTYNIILGKQDKLADLSRERKMESIIEDKYLRDLFPTLGYPSYIWIGPSGNLIAVTTALSVTKSHLTEILDTYREWKDKYGNN